MHGFYLLLSLNQTPPQLIKHLDCFLIQFEGSLKRMGTGNRNGSMRDKGSQQSGSSRFRSVKAWRRPDEDIDLPLDRCVCSV